MSDYEWQAWIEAIPEGYRPEPASALTVCVELPAPDKNGHTFYSAVGTYPTNDPFRQIRSRHVFDWGQYGAPRPPTQTVLEACLGLLAADLKRYDEWRRLGV